MLIHKHASVKIYNLERSKQAGLATEARARHELLVIHVESRCFLFFVCGCIDQTVQICVCRSHTVLI